MAAKFRLISNGNNTIAELDGKTIGAGIAGIQYIHDAKDEKKILLRLDIDLEEFHFMEDERFDRSQEAMMRKNLL